MRSHSWRLSECKLGAARLRKKERSADLKIYYDGRQCRGDPFKIRGTLKWNASKFNAQDRFVFNTPTIHTRRKAARVRDNGRRDGNLGDIFPLRSLPGRCTQASIKFFKFHEATRMSRNSKALNSTLIWCSCEIRAAKIRPSEFTKSFRKAANLAPKSLRPIKKTLAARRF